MRYLNRRLLSFAQENVAQRFARFAGSSLLLGKDPFAPPPSVQQRNTVKAHAAHNQTIIPDPHTKRLHHFLIDDGIALVLLSILSSFCFSVTSAEERPWRPSHEMKSFILTSCFMGGWWTRTVMVVNPRPISPTQLSFCNAATAIATAS